jgi:hypothetical protein
MDGLRGLVWIAALLPPLVGCEADTAVPPPAGAVVDAAPAMSHDSGDARCRLATAETSGGTDCPSEADADHDGVDDGEDRCPDTTPGVAVDASGCAATSD